MLAEQLKLQCQELLGQLGDWDGQRIRREEEEIQQTEQQLRLEEKKAAQAIHEYEEANLTFRNRWCRYKVKAGIHYG